MHVSTEEWGVLGLKYNRIVIGIDQSYTQTGISIIADGTILKVISVTPRGSDSKHDKRKMVVNRINQAIEFSQQRASKVIGICERIRAFKGSNLSLEYVATTGALIGSIADAFYEHNVPLYSVDTRVWKSAVVGTSKPAQAREVPPTVNPNKWPTLKYILNRPDTKRRWFLTEVSARTRKYDVTKGEKHYKYNDDAADACAIGLYGFVKKRNMRKEEG